MNILLKFATRSRPRKFKKCIDNIRNNISGGKHRYHILVTLDHDDTSMVMNDEIKTIAESEEVTIIYGNSLSKIDAINRDLNDFKYDWQILINFSDDMLFQNGFDETIRKDMAEAFSDLDGVLHYPDGNQGTNCMTMSVMGLKYYHRTNFIYHQSYKNLFCDNEAKDQAIILGKYKYCDSNIFKHNHPAWGLAQYDDQYVKTESREAWMADEKTYNERKANNFPND